MLWGNDWPLLDGLLDGSGFSLNTKSEVWQGEKSPCEMINLFLASLLDKFPILELPGKPFKSQTRGWTLVRLWGFDTLKLSQQSPCDTAKQGWGCKLGAGWKFGTKILYCRNKPTPRGLFHHSVRCGKTPRLDQFSKNPLKPNVTSIFKHFQKLRMLSAMQEGLCQAFVEWRSVQNFDSKKK